MGAIRGLCLGLIAAGLTAGLGTLATPQAQAALPGADSSSWIPVKKAGTVLTDGAGDFTTTHLDLTPSGGALGPAAGFVAADLAHVSFRFHVAALPASAAGGYVVQFDTDGNPAGWERALRYDPSTSTITFFTAGPNAGVTVAGTAGTTVPTTAATAASYAGADGGAHVAFAVSRAALTSAGIAPGVPMVMGTTSGTGAGLVAGGGLFVPVTADVLGTPAFGVFGAPGWGTLATDPIAIDSDGDGIADNADNCPLVANPGQEDFDNSSVDGGDGQLPPGENPGDPTDFPDGTEGMGDACDRTPKGYDPDGDGVGLLAPDECPERPGVRDNGCAGLSATVATLRYNARQKVFSGAVRGADYDECAPRRTVTVLRVVPGPDPELKTVKSNDEGKFSIKFSRPPKKGKYYVHVDPRNNLEIGLNCFADNSPKIAVR